MDPYNHIEAYINNTLSPAERQQMEQAMQDDPELFQMIQQYSTIAKVADGALEEDLLAMVERADKGTRLASTRRRWWLIGAIVLLVVLGTYSVWNYLQKDKVDSQELFVLYYQEPVWDITRNTDSTSMSISRAILMYEEGSWSSAIKELEKIDSTNDLYEISREYISEMLLAKESGDSAIVAIENLPSSHRKDWLKAMAYLKSENNPALFDELNKIRSQENHTYRERATQLMSEF